MKFYDETKPFSQQLKKAREFAFLTQAAMSRELNIPKITIEQWETDKRTPSAWAAELVLEKLDSLRKVEKQTKMKVKKLYNVPNYSQTHLVVETTDGKFYSFNHTPFRKITEDDLSPLHGFIPKGNHDQEAPDFMYCIYGLEKV